jgi:hypothetical protein
MKINTRFYFSLFLFIIISERFFLAKGQNTTVPVNVGVVLDLDTWNGKMGWSCINMALSDFYASHSYYKTRLRLTARDSKSDVVGAAAAGSLAHWFFFCFFFFFFFFFNHFRTAVKVIT